MKKNSNSCADESATEPTTKPASDDLNMSAGAEMLIARMKTNPEDFQYGAKFYRVVKALEDGQQWISRRDRDALRRAYDMNIVEGDFTEWVYGEIFNPKEPDVAAQRVYAQMQGQQAQIQAQMAQQMTTATGLHGNAIQNNLSSSPGSWTVSASSNATAEPHLTDSYIKKLKDKLGI
jgi:hypothetical protein